MTQTKQKQWHEQWTLLKDEEQFLFEDWIAPNRLSDFQDKTVLECGCGGGQHTQMMAPYAREIIAVDLNTIDVARQRNKDSDHISFLEADISEMNLNREFDIVLSVGVVHHTDDPDKTVSNLKRHVQKGGRLILWVYSKEGNFLAESVIEPIRKKFLRNLKRTTLLTISRIVTGLVYIPVYTVYLLPLRFLPYYDYFGNFRKLSFDRNVLNVFDKLNAPQVEFITKQRAVSWVSDAEFDEISVSAYKGVSWRISARKK